MSTDLKDWYSATELLQLDLPGLPKSKPSILSLAKRGGWKARRRKGFGGGAEYHVSSLPAPAREALTERYLTTAQRPVPVVQEPPPTTSLKTYQREVMEARLAILQEVDRLTVIEGAMAARATVVRLAREGRLAPHLQALVPVANARAGKSGSRTLSEASLRRWQKHRAERGAEGLATADGKRAMTAPPDWLLPFMMLYRSPGKPSISACYERLAENLPAGVELPSLRTVERTIARMGAVERNRGRMGPRELKRLRAYTVRDFSMLAPADVYTADGHCHDREVQHPVHGKPFRPEIISVLDVATRFCVGWSAGLAEGSWLVADALRVASSKAIAAIFYVDNGGGFKNELLNGPATGILARLGTQQANSLPYASQARGVIERFHASCWIRPAKFLPSYVGRDMDPEARKLVFRRSRKDIQARGSSQLIQPWSEFLAWAQEQVDAYNDRPHSSLPKIRDPETGKLRHQSPREAWDAAIAAGVELIQPEAGELDDLFRPYEIRTVVRGQIKLFGNTYFHRDLDRLDLHGREVSVGYDIHDPSRVWVRDMEGRLVCVAELDGNKQPYFPRSRIEQAREQRAAGRLRRLETKAEEIRSELGPSVIEMQPAALPAGVQARQQQLIEQFESTLSPANRDHTSEPASTFEIPQLADDRFHLWLRSDDHVSEAELAAEPTDARSHQAVTFAVPTGADERFALWCDLDRRINAGEAISDQAVRWHSNYRNQAEWKARMRMAADFGSAFPMTAAG